MTTTTDTTLFPLVERKVIKKIGRQTAIKTKQALLLSNCTLFLMTTEIRRREKSHHSDSRDSSPSRFVNDDYKKQKGSISYNQLKKEATVSTKRKTLKNEDYEAKEDEEYTPLIPKELIIEANYWKARLARKLGMEANKAHLKKRLQGEFFKIPMIKFAFRFLPLLALVYGILFLGMLMQSSTPNDGSALHSLRNVDRAKTSQFLPYQDITPDHFMSDESQPQNLLLSDMQKTGLVLPNLMLVGAQKAGTSALAEWLFENGVCRPQVFEGEPDYYKEGGHFFDQKIRFDQGVEFYAKRFQYCNVTNYAMDSTPNTLPLPGHVEKIYKDAGGDHLKNLKVIVVLREPVSRELALYNHKVFEYMQTKEKTQWYSNVAKEDGEIMPFYDYVDILVDNIHPDPWGIDNMGVYVEHLRNWLKFTDRKHLLIISYDEFHKDPQKVEGRISNFLGVAFTGRTQKLDVDQNNEKVESLPCYAQEKLNTIFGPSNQALYQLLKEQPGPPQEQAPFPEFRQAHCLENDEFDKAQEIAREKSTKILLRGNWKKRPAWGANDIPKPDQVVLPNVLLIGVQKAGTSSIATWLFENGVCRPEVFAGEPSYFDKEVQFFDQENRFMQGSHFYSKRFQNCKDKPFAMDATPNTLRFPEHVKKIYEQAGGDFLKNLKIITMLREPVSRELSLFNHKVDEYLQTRDQDEWYGDVSRDDGSVMSFAEFGDQIIHDIENPGLYGFEWGMADISIYVDHLKKWMGFIDRKNLMVLSYDEFKKDPRISEGRVRQFLGSDFPGHAAHTDVLKMIGQKVEVPSCFAQKKLNSLFQPKNQALYDLLGSKPGPDAEAKPFPAFDQLECADTDIKAEVHIEGKIVLPNILLAGALKAGTTAISDWLFENGVCRPEVFDDEPPFFNKHVMFFDQPGRFEKGLPFYARRFQHCKNSAFVMDATPNTLSFPHNVENTYKLAGGDYLKNLQVIVVLREPVSREISLYNHKVDRHLQSNGVKSKWYADVSRDDGSLKPFHDYIDNIVDDIRHPGEWDGKWGMSDAGHYAHHLEEWLHFVERKNLLIISYDEFKSEPKIAEGRIRQFLGFDFPGSTPYTNMLSNKDQKMNNPSCYAQKKLNEVFDPMNTRLYEFLYDNPGPEAEQKPFPSFKQLSCVGDDGKPVEKQERYDVDKKYIVLPNILVVGTQRAGAASIGLWLYEHGTCRPEVFNGEPEFYESEVQFFDQEGRYNKGLGFYTKRFQHCSGQKFIMDATPNTLSFPDHVEAIYKEAGGDHLKNLKIIVVLREPVSRELSLYNQKVYEYLQTQDRNQWYSDISKADGSMLPFYDHVDSIIRDIENPGDWGLEWGLGDAGFYAKHLSKWLKFVDRKSLLAINYDELNEDSNSVEGRVSRFLGYEFPEHTRKTNVLRHKQRIEMPSCHAQKRLNYLFKPQNQDLYELLNSDAGPDAEQKPFPSFKQLDCVETDVKSKDRVKKSMVLPNVLLIGALKAGTSAIASWLFENGVCRPQVMDGEPSYYNQEVQFFDQQGRYEKGLDFYAKRYRHCNSSAFAMDATPDTLSFPQHVEATYKEAGGDYLKNLKVVAVLREPVSRELSLYNHKLDQYMQNKAKSQWYSDVSQEDGSVKPFFEHIDQVIRDIKDPGDWGLEWGSADTSNYAKHLSRWLNVLDRKNLLLISYDEFKYDPKSIEGRIRQFLGFDFPGSTPYTNKLIGDHKVENPSCYAQKTLNEIFGPMNNKLYDLLKENPGPEAEQKPFPSFEHLPCTGKDGKPVVNQEQYDDVEKSSIVLPNVLVIGAQKAGASAIGRWLYENGACRPDVFDGEPEFYNSGVQFFDQEGRYNKGLGFYAKRFQHCNISSFALDATPNTLSFPGHVEAIYKEAGDAQLRNLKVIVMLREPVSRELSLYNHKVYEYLQTKAKDQWYSDVSKADGSLLPFYNHADAVIRDIADPGDWGLEWGLGDAGIYAKHLSKWLEFVDRKNLLAIDYDEFKEDSKAVEGRVRQFLGFDFPGSTPFTNVYRHKEKVEKPDCRAQKKLNAIFELKNQDLYELLNSKPGSDAEQKPFPSFKQLECIDTDVKSDIQRSMQIKDSKVLPNILLVGALKAGSSAISEWLFENGVCRPDVFDGEPEYYNKEVMFFDQKGRYVQGLDFYAKRFEHCKDSAYAMDATPNTFSFPHNVEAIYKQAGDDYLKNLKVIAVLREPVSRELSLYNHKVAEYMQTHSRNQWYSDVATNDGSVIPFHEHSDEVLSAFKYPDEWGLGDTGHYAKHLGEWMKFVDRKNLLVLSYDEFKKDSETVEGRIRQFLAFNFPGSTPYTTIYNGRIPNKKPSCYAQTKLNEVFEPMNQELYKLLNSKSGPPAEQKPFLPFKQLDCVGTGKELEPVQREKKELDKTSLVLPNVLLIGAQKAGTSSMGMWLFKNGICRPKPLEGEPDFYDHEVQFFDHKGRYEQGLNFYAQRFQHCNSSQFVMDATPNTLVFPDRVEAIYKEAGGEHLKNLKVIVVLREPVSRELSLYNHKVYQYLQTKAKDQWYSDISKEDGSLLPFQDHANNVLHGVQNPEEEGLADIGNYARHLNKWLQFVDRKNLLAISYDEFKGDPRTSEGRIRNFLGHDFPQTSSFVNVLRNKERIEAPPCAAQDKLNSAFDPMNQALYELLNSKPGPDAEQKPFPKFSPFKCTGTPEPLVLPNVLLIGAQKAGTTAIGRWLYDNGACRPDHFSDEPYYYDKEVQFFDQKSRYEQGLQFYARRYAHCRGEKFALDATPNTLRFPEHVEETYKKARGDYLKNLKVIAVLREPIARELSLYNHRVFEYLQSKDRTQWYSDVSKEDGSVMSFHEYTDILTNDLLNPKEYGKEWGLANEGQYVLHLKKWANFVDRTNILVIAYDELKNNPRQVEQRIEDFLGLDFPGTTGIENSNEHEKKVKHPECKTITKLNPHFESMTQDLYKFLEEHAGPDSEQRPFQIFAADKECTGDKEATSE